MFYLRSVRKDGYVQKDIDHILTTIINLVLPKIS